MEEYIIPIFHTAYEPQNDAFAEFNTEPSCTIPDQSLSIPEIIARFTRSGLVPQAMLHSDDGGNIAGDPDFDPMDEFDPERIVADLRQEAALDSPQEPDQAPSGESSIQTGDGAE